MKPEKDFQRRLIKDLKKLFPGCLVIKGNANYKQGIPDLLIFHGKHWAALECKRTKTSTHRPNQDYYVEKMNNMSYASFVYPENRDEVLNDLERTFES